MWLLYGLAFAVSLTVYNMANVASGVWIALFMAFIFLMAYKHEMTFKPEAFGIALVGWFVLLCVHVFLIKPSMGGAVYVATFSAVPLSYLCFNSSDNRVRRILDCALSLIYVVLIAFALLLFYEKAFWPVDKHAFRPWASWPMLNPNGAATVLLFGLIPSFWNYLKTKHLLWLMCFLVFCLGLVSTGSVGAGVSALAGCLICMVVMHPISGMLLGWIGGISGYALFHSQIDEKILVRMPIWEATIKMIKSFPVLGVGVGNFPVYYSLVKTEETTQGIFAHNDILQLAATLGIPMALLYVMVWVLFFKQWKEKLTPAFAVVAAVLIHSMVEFPLYLPPVQLLLAVTVVYVGRNLQRNTDLVCVL